MNPNSSGSRGRLLRAGKSKTSHRPKKRVSFWVLVGGAALGLMCLQAGLLKDVFGDPTMARVFKGAVVLIYASVLVGAIIRARLT